MITTHIFVIITMVLIMILDMILRISRRIIIRMAMLLRAILVIIMRMAVPDARGVGSTSRVKPRLQPTSANQLIS